MSAPSNNNRFEGPSALRPIALGLLLAASASALA
jgi:hypothetical protein